MAIFKTAYDTTIGKAFQISKIEKDLKLYIVQHGETSLFEYIISSVDLLPIELCTMTGNSEIVPYFNHPFLLERFRDKKYLFLDSRLFKKINNNVISITSKNEYEFLYQRYLFNYIWLCFYTDSIRINLSFAGTVMSNWLAELIARRFVLDPREQIVISIIVATYYQQLFMNDYELTDIVKNKIAMGVKKNVGATMDMIYAVIDQTTKMSNVEDLAKNISTIVDNIRLQEFSHGLIYNLIGSSWFGYNAKENMAVALEHIPTWLAICYNSLTNSGYKKSIIATVATKFVKNNKDCIFFIKECDTLLSHILVKTISKEDIDKELIALESKVF